MAKRVADAGVVCEDTDHGDELTKAKQDFKLFRDHHNPDGPAFLPFPA